jgi:4-oxalocrotonate tautomerase
VEGQPQALTTVDDRRVARPGKVVMHRDVTGARERHERNPQTAIGGGTSDPPAVSSSDRAATPSRRRRCNLRPRAVFANRMPLVRITGRHDVRTLRALGEAVHDALVTAIGIPPDDRFQILTPATAETLVADAEYLGHHRESPAIVEITFRAGRSNDKKRALYAAIARGAERAGVRADDVMVVLHENEPVDWSFGGGIADYAPTG